jgi:hypothetical protein
LLAKSRLLLIAITAINKNYPFFIYNSSVR